MTFLSTVQESSICKQYQQGLSTPAIARKFHVRHKRVLGVLRRYNVKIRTISESTRKYHCNEKFFESINSEKTAYFLGLLFADGCIIQKLNRVIINLKHTDKDILIKFKDALEASHPLTYSAKKGYEPAARLAISSQKMVTDLNGHGCHERKSATIRWPKISEDFVWHFLRGFIDGDGCIYKSPKGICVLTITSNLLFLSETQAFLLQNGIVSHIHTLTTKGAKSKLFGALRVTGIANVKELLQKTYCNASVFLARKYVKANECLALLTEKARVTKRLKVFPTVFSEMAFPINGHKTTLK